MHESEQLSEWDLEYDVVVVGFGGAGAAAAIAAADLGVSVLIAEKAPEGEHGGNTRVSGQGYLNLSSSEKAAEYLRALSWPEIIPDDLVGVWAQEMVRNNEWFSSIGGDPHEHMHQPESIEYPELPGADCVHRYHHGELRGYSNTWRVLEDAVGARAIDVLFDSPARRLVPHPSSGEILGVVLSRQGRSVRVKARRAVILACGGFEGSLDMVRTYLPGVPYCYPSGTPHNEGDGIRMALAVGADLWHMNSFAGPSLALKVAELPTTLSMRALHFKDEFPGGMIVVGPDGRRFGDEKLKSRHGKTLQNGRWRPLPTTYPMYMIFDHALFSSGPLYDKTPYNGWTRVVERYDWSDDNEREIERGWIRRARTIASLATQIGIDPDSLARSVREWNAGCELGRDPEFGRTLMLDGFGAGPYYAVELVTTMFNTQGGPRKNARGEVIRAEGDAIGRLYCCGELGSIFGNLYQGAGNIAEGFGFARVCARNAVAESPWIG